MYARPAPYMGAHNSSFCSPLNSWSGTCRTKMRWYTLFYAFRLQKVAWCTVLTGTSHKLLKTIWCTCRVRIQRSAPAQTRKSPNPQFEDTHIVFSCRTGLPGYKGCGSPSERTAIALSTSIRMLKSGEPGNIARSMTACSREIHCILCNLSVSAAVPGSHVYRPTKPLHI